MALMDNTATEVAKMIKNKEISVKEVVLAALDNIEKKESNLNAFISIDKDGALKRAEEVQKLIDNGELTGNLAGIPVAVKDNICIEGGRVTCGSKILENFISPYSATAVKKLEEAGMIIIGKTNMDEFAMGNTSETSINGPVKNPCNQNLVSGGSSGGSCAAVASGESLLALGSDTGGSIRQPAAYCGMVGMKPTYGTVSRYGFVAYASSLEQISPVGKNVTDCVSLLQAIAGYDDRDSTSVRREKYDFTSSLINDVRGMKIGIPKEFFAEGLDKEIKNMVLDAIKLLKEKGAIVSEFSLGLAQYAVPAYYVIACAEASSNLARFDGVRYGRRAKNYEDLAGLYKNSRTEGFGSEVKKRIMLGAYVLSSGHYDEYYLKAVKVKELIKREYERAFSRFDVIVSPVSPEFAPEIGKEKDNILNNYLADVYTVSANLCGIPAISVPCGVNGQGKHMGIQFMGDMFREDNIIRVAYTYEQSK